MFVRRELKLIIKDTTCDLVTLSFIFSPKPRFPWTRSFQGKITLRTVKYEAIEHWYDSYCMSDWFKCLINKLMQTRNTSVPMAAARLNYLVTTPHCKLSQPNRNLNCIISSNLYTSVPNLVLWSFRTIYRRWLSQCYLTFCSKIRRSG